ncbi:response regulator [Deinococcus deserti]|uniref:Putative response regulator, CheY n=1 Tax=Deinococcus deserti (strain DSM 17065 / CIP 109153 / LMG 22923 / VCD115) TaxID=546414 RepID=C1D3W8_DEIDV|nr:response regulator [Deinococcus deserti]ACO48197.2 putative response regulator, CheY [Deinococcus deserti VCD115]
MNRKSFTLLLVEDELADVALFQDLLADAVAEVDVIHVENGRQALQYLNREDQFLNATYPDLVVLDLNMPVMNGHDFLAHVKQQPELRSIPVMILSTSDHPDDIQRAYHGYASGYVVKPSTYEEFVRVVKTIEAYWRGLVRLPSIAEVATRAAR